MGGTIFILSRLEHEYDLPLSALSTMNILSIAGRARAVNVSARDDHAYNIDCVYVWHSEKLDCYPGSYTALQGQKRWPASLQSPR